VERQPDARIALAHFLDAQIALRGRRQAAPNRGLDLRSR
jgi:hypothetical protein